MLTIEQVKSLNELEMGIYDYIMQHKEKVLHMKIRELATEAHVSTTTILRFCKKAGCNGFAEFKIKFKLYLQRHEAIRIDHDIPLMLDFFNKINSNQFFKEIEEVAQIIQVSDFIICIGIGTSGLLGQYAARTFTNYGKLAFSIQDPFYPIAKGCYEKSCVIALSESGETTETIQQLKGLMEENSTTIAITNKEDCTISRMSDYHFHYYMPEQRMHQFYNVTTQVPVIFILETLAKRVKELMDEA